MAFAVKLCTSSGVKPFAVIVVRLETIVVVVSLGRLSFRANACNKSLFRKKYAKGLSTSGQI